MTSLQNEENELKDFVDSCIVSIRVRGQRIFLLNSQALSRAFSMCEQAENRLNSESGSHVYRLFQELILNFYLIPLTTYAGYARYETMETPCLLRLPRKKN